MGVEDYSTTPGSNTAINGIDMSNNNPPSAMNDGVRQIAADIKSKEAIQSKSADYTIVKGDYGNLIEFTAAATATMTAVATLGDNWVCYVWANGGAVTIDGDGSETINGKATLDLPKGSWARVWSDGTELHALVTSGDRDYGLRNLLNNPTFRVDMEGNASGVSTDGDHVVEGWALHDSSDATVTLSRVAGTNAQYALKFNVDVADTSIAAGQYSGILTAAEGLDAAKLKWGTAQAKDGHISKRIYSNGFTGNISVTLRNAAANYSYSKLVPLVSGAWTELDFTIPAQTSGTWEATTNAGFLLYIAAAAGSTYAVGTDETWTTNNALAVSGTGNFLATGSNYLLIEEPSLSVGGPISPEVIPYATELNRCQRYFQSYGGEYEYEWFSTAFAYSTSVYYGTLHFVNEMRESPTASISASSHFQVLRATTTTTPTSLVVSQLGKKSCTMTATKTSTFTAGQGGGIRANNTTSARIYLDARLI